MLARLWSLTLKLYPKECRQITLSCRLYDQLRHLFDQPRLKRAGRPNLDQAALANQMPPTILFAHDRVKMKTLISSSAVEKPAY